MRHHHVFTNFSRFCGEVPAFRQADFLGTTIRRQFVAGLAVASIPSHVTTEYPAVDEEYFEWIDLLESVVAARDSYTMIELGAGFGRWIVRAARAVEHLHPSVPYYVIGVEGEPTVCEWMRLHFRDNGVRAERCCSIHAAVSETGREVLFYIGGPQGGPFDCNPNAWYGQRITHDYDAESEYEIDGYYKGYPVVRHHSGWRSIRVPGVRLSSLLKNQQKVDLIDMDVEGQELALIQATIDALDAKVKRVHIGTHGKEIETGLRELFRAHGWSCQADYSLSSTNETPWGIVRFGNGAQSWVNPGLQ